MAVLTVGTGGEFNSISDAVAASHDGDVIKVQAGTYTDDFLTVNSRVTIEGVGGMVHLLGTQTPPNGKGLITASADLTIENFELSGAADQWSPTDGNISAIRDQSGNLVVENCYIHDNQEGILAGDDLNGSVVIDHTEIANNGSDGLTHNVYINNVGRVVLSNSYIHDALFGGTEFRSRGPNTTIINNRIFDNQSEANYIIDVPSGGNVVIQDNVLQKTANPDNDALIDWGGSVVVPFHDSSSLNLTNNVILNDDTARLSLAILNDSYLNNATGQIVLPTLSGNQFFGVPTTNVSNLGTYGSGNTFQSLAEAPQLDTSHPWTAPTSVWDPSADPADVLLTTQFLKVTGGVTKLTVTDTVGHNTIIGGSGGTLATLSGVWDTVVTASGAADTVSASGTYALVQSAGQDVLNITGLRDVVVVTGRATINGGTQGENDYLIQGEGVVRPGDSDTVDVSGGSATVTAAYTSFYATETDGALRLAQTGTAPASTPSQNGGAAVRSIATPGQMLATAAAGGGTSSGSQVLQAATVSGGGATVGSGSTGTSITTAVTGGVSVGLGVGTAVVKSYGADTICAGSGTAYLTVSGNASILGGSGKLEVDGTGGAITVKAGGSAFSYYGYSGTLNFVGGSGSALIEAGPSAVSVSGGSGSLTLVQGSADDLFQAGSGRAFVYGGTGNDTIQFGSGATTVTGGAGQDLYRFVPHKGGGTDLINGFKIGTDKLDFGGTAIRSQNVNAGSLNLNLVDGTRITLSGITQLTSDMLV